jgi:2-(1,2-epoxy-1,2-dihydrophenyl)acetyl-CoA isomerase
METPKTLLLEIREHVAHITLNRPEVSNAMNLEMSREFYEAALECEQSSDLRAVLITGAGRAFCSGGDVKSFAAQEPSRLPAYYRRITLFLHQAIHHLARMRAPVVMAVNGTAGGGGMSLACAGDIVLASESARFTMAYTQIGLTPDGSSTYYLPRIIGLRRTLELALTNRVLSAREAETIGLVTRVIPDDQLMAHAQTLVAELAKGPRGLTKESNVSFTARRTLHLPNRWSWRPNGLRIWPEPLTCKKGLPPFWPNARRNSTAASAPKRGSN